MTIEKKLADALRAIDSAERALRAFTVADLNAMRAALAAYDNAPPGFTVCLQKVGDTETTHVTYQAGASRYDAIQAAKRECLNDWQVDGELDLHVLAVFVGDVEVLEWEDQA